MAFLEPKILEETPSKLGPKGASDSKIFRASLFAFMKPNLPAAGLVPDPEIFGLIPTGNFCAPQFSVIQKNTHINFGAPKFSGLISNNY